MLIHTVAAALTYMHASTPLAHATIRPSACRTRHDDGSNTVPQHHLISIQVHGVANFRVPIQNAISTHEPTFE